MEIDYKQFGYQIQCLRMAKHISQEELAELADMSVSNLGYIENGDRRGSMDSIFSIACALEVPIDAFLLGQGPEYRAHYSHAFYELFSDCTPFEAKVVYEVAVAAKKACKDNARLIYHNKNRGG